MLEEGFGVEDQRTETRYMAVASTRSLVMEQIREIEIRKGIC